MRIIQIKGSSSRWPWWIWEVKVSPECHPFLFQSPNLSLLKRPQQQFRVHSFREEERIQVRLPRSLVDPLPQPRRDARIPMPKTRDHVAVDGKRDFGNVIKGLNLERLSWWPQCNHSTFKRGGQRGSEGKEVAMLPAVKTEEGVQVPRNQAASLEARNPVLPWRLQETRQLCGPISDSRRPALWEKKTCVV